MISVLVVDDDALTLELHRTYLERVPGFRVSAECTGARAAVSAILEQRTEHPIDLVLLDITMPDGTGLDVLRHVRARAADVDVIAVTGVRDAEVVRQMVGLGVVQYLVKPFSFAVFRDRLEQYREYRDRVHGTSGAATQAEIDALLGARDPSPRPSFPRGSLPRRCNGSSRCCARAPPGLLPSAPQIWGCLASRRGATSSSLPSPIA